MDSDPQGFRRFEKIIIDPLKFAQGLVDHLMAACPDDVDTQLAVFDLALRKQTLGPALTALEEAVRLSTNRHPGVIQRLFPFAYFVRAGSGRWKRVNKGGTFAIMYICMYCELMNVLFKAQFSFILDAEQKARLDGLVGAPNVETACLAFLADSDEQIRVATANALLVIDLKKYQGPVETALGKTTRPLDVALAAREVLSQVEGGAKAHLDLCLASWPLASKLFKR